MFTAARRRGTRIVWGFLAVVLLLGAGVLPAEAAVPARADPLPDDGTYFGSVLEWSSDSISEQSQRLGAPSALYQHDAGYPLSPADRESLAGFFRQTAAAGSVPIVTLRPTVDLASLDVAEAEEFVASLDGIALPDDAPFFLSFAPDMNATWVDWGQQPTAYRAAFTTLARVVHERMPEASMMWSPFWGGDYPFSAAERALGARAEADTDGDGLVGEGDDPYSPYYPGEAAVDAVGLSVFYDETAGGHAVNVVPDASAFVSRLTGAGALDVPDFVAAYASPTQPLLVETGAFYSASAVGPSEREVKQAWWRQIQAAVDSGVFGDLKAIIWRDTVTTRGAVGETVIDWSATLSSNTVARAFVADLQRSDLQLGPVREPLVDVRAVPTAGSARLSGAAGWAVAAGVAAAVALLAFFALRRRGGASTLSYSGSPARDGRIDLLRGMAIVFVVVNHLALTSFLQNATQEFIGIVSGAELFVLLSGSVLGLVYRPKLTSGGIGEVVIRTGRRAWRLYCTALAVVVLVFFLSLVPFLNGSVVTSFVDQGTGAAGAGATGRVYDLYAGAERLLDYPADPHAVVDFLLLRVGPWQFNVMGLYVLLVAISPIVLAALARRWWILVLTVSGLLYGVGVLTRVRLLPSQFEDSFPLLVWQFLFVLGITAGFYRREIIAWFSSRVGVVALCGTVAAATALMLLSWNSPFSPAPADIRLGLITDNAFRAVYGLLFERTYLAPGRLLNVLVLVVALYALLSAYWKPIAGAVGWFFIPLGQATLYVFVMHVFLALAAASIPLLREGDVWVNTAANIVILVLLWTMVKTRFLYRIVPR